MAEWAEVWWIGVGYDGGGGALPGSLWGGWGWFVLVAARYPRRGAGMTELGARV